MTRERQLASCFSKRDAWLGSFEHKILNVERPRNSIGQIGDQTFPVSSNAAMDFGVGGMYRRARRGVICAVDQEKCFVTEIRLTVRLF